MRRQMSQKINRRRRAAVLCVGKVVGKGEKAG
jgi:hypothetical protein